MASTSNCDHRGRHSKRSKNTWAAVDADKDVGSSVACIDLTVDVSNDDFIDLTHGHTLTNTDSPVEVFAPTDDIGPLRTRRIGRKRKHQIKSRRGLVDPVEHSSMSASASSRVHVLSDDSDSDSLPEMPFEFTPPSEAELDMSKKSSEGVQISCPVCLDNIKEAQRSGRQMMSTNCGHIFCEDCIREAISIQHTCPTCRKKITQRSVHPLFL